jgi:hypothetical protein
VDKGYAAEDSEEEGKSGVTVEVSKRNAASASGLKREIRRNAERQARYELGDEIRVT